MYHTYFRNCMILEFYFLLQLDAKKSPLALLAQTCSSIGKDSTPSKSIIPPLEKSSKDSKDSSSTSSNNGDSKPGSPKNEDGKSSEKKDRSSPSSDSGKSGSFRAPAPKDIPPLVPISSSGGDRSPAPGEPNTSKSSSRDGHNTPTSSSHGPRSPSASAGVNSNSRISLSCGNMLLEVNHQESALAAAKTSAASSSRPEAPSAVHPTLGPYPHLGLGHSVEALAASPFASHHPSLTAHGLASAASRSAAGAPSISPYSYARVKTAAGATTLVPICRDPYCTNCQITMQSAQLTSACAAGCTQCNHEKSPAYLSVPTSLGLSSLGGSVPILPFPPTQASLPPTGASALHMASSLYGHAFGILPGHHTLPYVCNWMAGSDYCGKRFANSEELLQHLRTHTSSSEAALAGLSAFPGLGLPSAAALAAAGCHSHLNPPPSLSPNSLRQAYPRSLSPNTLLAASRYHPYKHLSSLPPTGSLTPSGLPSALSAYYSPYALYGQRIGAAAVAP